MRLLLRLVLVLALAGFAVPARAALSQDQAHVWEMQEIILQAQHDYANPYVDVQCWIELKGPGFDKRVYGFWDGGRTFRIRFVATAPGEWTWRTGSNQPDDAGLNAGAGALRALPWTQSEIEANANRRGFVHATANGHALQYADGTPFFLTGDTWLAASTWRLPWRGGAEPAAGYVPASGISFEDAVAYRKRQGFQLRQLHRGISKLGGRQSRRDLCGFARRQHPQCLGEVRHLGPERQGHHRRRRHHHRQEHGRRTGQHPVRHRARP